VVKISYLNISKPIVGTKESMNVFTICHCDSKLRKLKLKKKNKKLQVRTWQLLPERLR